MRDDNRRFWWLNAAAWSAFTTLWLVLGATYAGGYSGVVLINLTHGVMLCLASGGLRALALRRGWLQRDAVAIALRMVAASAAAATLVQAMIAIVLLPALALDWVSLPGGQADYRPGATLMYWINTFVVLVLWAAAWVGGRALRRARDSELARLKVESERQGMELELLRARLNPHFVFNALNNLRALINEDPARARELVTRLSSTLRQALEHNPRERVTLAEELAVVEDYLGVEGVHYEQRLRVRRSIADDALDASLPPMALQLLVENAIKHGIACTPGGGELTIDARLDGDRLQVQVGNPGHLRPASARRGVGLAYLRMQLGRMVRPGTLELHENSGRVLASMEVTQ